MTNLRRLMVVVLAIAMIATSMATAFGAPMSDISGKKYEDAVNKLASFNIVAGDNGQFKGEDKLTRAEFATFIVNMMNLGKPDPVDTIFSDATSKDWFSGYVELASNAGYIVGADGKFKPTDYVTYGQAITVLMKMLGYAPVVDNRGTWPTNYIARASSIKLTKDVSVSANAYVTRGNLAILMWATMAEPMLIESGVYDEDGNPNYEKADKADPANAYKETLLYKNFDEAVVENSDDGVKVSAIPMTDDVKKDQIKIGTEKFTVPAGYDANSLLGLSINYVSDKDNNLKWIGIKTKSDYIITDTVKELEKESPDYRIKMATSDKDYYFDPSEASIVYNGVPVTSTANLDKLLPYVAASEYVKDYQDPAKVVAVLDKNSSKIISLFITQDIASDVMTADDATIFGNPFFGLVNEITDDGYIKGERFDDINKDDLLDKDSVNAVKLIVYKDGKVASLKDIKKDDLLRGTVKGNTHVYFDYTPKIETVKIDSLDDATDLRDVVVIAGDKKIKFGSASFKLYKTAISDRNDLNLSDLSKLIGVEGTKVYYGPSGKVHFIVNKVADATDLYGIVTHVEDKLNDGDNVQEITLYKPDGTTVTYLAANDGVNEVEQGDVITYTLSKNNEIVSLTVSATRASAAFDGDEKYLVTNVVSYNDDGSFKTEAADKNYFVNSSTVFVNWANYDKFNPAKEDNTFDMEQVSWSAVLDASAPRGLKDVLAADEREYSAWVTVKDGLVKFVVLKENDASLVGDSRFGIVVGTGLDEDGRFMKVNYKGKVTDYRYSVAADNDDSVYGIKGLPVIFSASGDDIEITDVSDTVYNYSSDSRLTFDYDKFTAGSIYVAKVTSLDATERTMQYRRVKDYKGTNYSTAINAMYLTDKVVIYDLRDVNNITYTTDISKIEKDMIIVYDKAYDPAISTEDPVILIINKNSDYTKSQLKYVPAE